MKVNYLNARAEFLEWHQIPLTDKLPKQIAMGCQLWPFLQGGNREGDQTGNGNLRKESSKEWSFLYWSYQSGGTSAPASPDGRPRCSVSRLGGFVPF